MKVDTKTPRSNMAAELSLKALREFYEQEAYQYPHSAAFILRQIERVQECDCDEGHKDCGCGYPECDRMVRCPFCADLRADLLRLQREVL